MTAADLAARPPRWAWWRAAQLAAVAATAGVIVGAFLAPRPTLVVLWEVIVPLVPLSLLIAPSLWRNLCPLATANLLVTARGRRRLRRGAAGSAAIGIALLALMVPARRFLFNVDGPALGVTVTAVAALALALGAVFDRKAGFCNSICPVLPVERLYGQRPWLDLDNPRCTPCTRCTGLGCLDRSKDRAVAQTLGRRRGMAWLATPFGVFTGAFPGFVLGYFLTEDGPLTSAGHVYLVVGAAAAASLAATAVAVALTGAAIEVVVPLAAAAAAGLYYWFAAPVVTAALGAPAAAIAVRAATLTVVALWLLRALRARPPRRASPARAPGARGPTTPPR